MNVDIVVYDDSGQIALIAEVKNKLGTSSDWATMLRRNMLAHGALPSTKFFLLALPDRFYLWKNSGNRAELVPPTLEIDPRSLLDPYYEKAGVMPEQISSRSFELIIAAWLSDLLRSDAPVENKNSTQSWIDSSGFLGTIVGGRLDHEVSL